MYNYNTAKLGYLSTGAGPEAMHERLSNNDKTSIRMQRSAVSPISLNCSVIRTGNAVCRLSCLIGMMVSCFSGEPCYG